MVVSRKVLYTFESREKELPLVSLGIFLPVRELAERRVLLAIWDRYVGALPFPAFKIPYFINPFPLFKNASLFCRLNLCRR